jgi:hypothetical protein
MARWLAALRNDEKKSEIATDENPQNPQNSPGGFEGFEGRRPEPFSNFHCKGWAVWDEEDWQTAFDERAAILEYDGGLTRSEASRLARQQVNEQRSDVAIERCPKKRGRAYRAR